MAQVPALSLLLPQQHCCCCGSTRSDHGERQSNKSRSLRSSRTPCTGVYSLLLTLLTLHTARSHTEGEHPTCAPLVVSCPPVCVMHALTPGEVGTLHPLSVNALYWRLLGVCRTMTLVWPEFTHSAFYCVFHGMFVWIVLAWSPVVRCYCL